MRLSCLLGLSVLGAAPLVAAQAVTEGDFLSGFNAESAAVRSLGDGVAAAEAARQRAGALANPRVEFWREQPEESPRVTNWTLSWTPPLDGRYGVGKKAADAGVAAARERLAASRVALRRELRAAFAAWSLAFEQRGVLREQLDRVRELALAERQRARAGEESGLSARRFTLAEAEVRNALGETEAELARAEARARAWRPDLPAAAEPARLTSPEPPPPTEGSTPELRALEHEAEQAALDKKRAGRFLGFPTLQFGWQRLDDAGLVRSGPILAAGWTVPLFDRDHAERLETARRQEIAAARLELGRARVAGEIAGSAAAYQALFAAAREAGDALEDGERVTTAATAAYRAGEASLTDLLDCLRAALAARIGEIALRERVLEAHREVEAALGQPLSGGGW